MQMNQIIGLVVFAIGVVLLVAGYNASNAPMDQLSNEVTGRFTDKTMWYFGIGIAAVVGGGLLFFFKGRRRA